MKWLTFLDLGGATLGLTFARVARRNFEKALLTKEFVRTSDILEAMPKDQQVRLLSAFGVAWELRSAGQAERLTKIVQGFESDDRNRVFEFITNEMRASMDLRSPKG